MSSWSHRRLVPGLALILIGSASIAPAVASNHSGPLHRLAATISIVQYRPPLPQPLRVLTPFDPPVTRYGPGHLGVDLAADQGAAVRSAGAGTVTFAGSVAGRGVVVVSHPDGIRTEYEPVRPDVKVAAIVDAGTLLGHVEGQHASCAPASCLHWGARRGTTYLDPLNLLRALGPVRLLPWPA